MLTQFQISLGVLESKGKTDMLDLFISWMDKRGSSRMIRRLDPDSGKVKDYLKRYYIFKSSYFSVFIHQFWSSDEDHIHDHPWNNITYILRGGYWEFSADGTAHYRDKGFFKYRNAEIFHKIAIGNYAPGTVWTLFIHFKRKREWGFYTPEGWLPAKIYGEKYGYPVKTQQDDDFKLVGCLFPKILYL